MRRPVKRHRFKLAAESQRLINLATAVAQSSSRREDMMWQEKLDQIVGKNLKQQHNDLLEAAAEHLFHSGAEAYEVMVETMETVSTTLHADAEGVRYCCQLIAAPVLAWTRFEIASGAIPADILVRLSEALHQHVLGKDVRLKLLPNLYSIDQLPRNFCETHALLERHATALLKNSSYAVEADRNQTVPFLADVRLLLGIVVVPERQTVFQWEDIAPPYDSQQARTSALEAWQQAAEPHIHRILPGCGTELLLPESYYSACREADVRIRPASVRATIYYLTQTLNKEPSDLSVIISAVGNPDRPEQTDEFRISFLLKDAPEVVYGVIWPLYTIENQEAAISIDDHGQLSGEIYDNLIEAGAQDVTLLPDPFGMEFCDDCGTPLFADRDGELAHPELPEGAPEPGSTHFH